jgi:hypothetical protein
LLVLVLVPLLRLPFLLQPDQPALYAKHGTDAATAMSCRVFAAAAGQTAAAARVSKQGLHLLHSRQQCLYNGHNQHVLQ